MASADRQGQVVERAAEALQEEYPSVLVGPKDPRAAMSAVQAEEGDLVTNGVRIVEVARDRQLRHCIAVVFQGGLGHKGLCGIAEDLTDNQTPLQLHVSQQFRQGL